MDNPFAQTVKYKAWLKSHNFDNCKLNRKDYGEFLADYITGEHNGFVLNLNGSWGTGKTEFLKRLYSLLIQRQYPTIYIDSWESDFSKEPLTVVTSELLNQLEILNSGIGDEATIQEVKKVAGKVFKALFVGVAGVASGYLLNDSSIGTSAAEQLVQGDNEKDFAEKLTQEHKEQVEAIQQIKAALGQLAEVLAQNYGAKLPVVVLIDELDRCRPTYSIEMLEVIKHFFSTDNFVFVVATDTEQLCHSITSVYGNDFDSLQYLKRFFDRKATLPDPDIKEYLNVMTDDFEVSYHLALFPLINSTISKAIKHNIALLAKAYGLKIRDVDQLVAKFKSCLRTAEATGARTEWKQVINIPVLAMGLIEQDRDMTSYEARNNRNAIFHQPLDANLEFDEGVSITMYVDMMMQSVVFEKVMKPDELGGLEEHWVLPTVKTLTDNYLAQKAVKPLREVVAQISNQTKLHDTVDVKYWLWSDYKRVIELAGNLT